MSTKLTVRRNERSTYEVHIETGDPPKNLIGGQSLKLEHLRTELHQHGCPDEAIMRTLLELEERGFSIVCL